MTKMKTSLTEEDYLSIIGLHHRFVQCKSRDALYECLERHFLSQLNCQSALFSWINPDFSTNAVVGSVGVSKECADYFGKLDPYMKSMNEKLVTNVRSVIACDVDVTRKTIIKDSSPFYRDHPEYKRPAAGIGYCIATGKVVTTYMLAIDRSEDAIILLARQQNLWVIFGSGNFPST